MNRPFYFVCIFSLNVLFITNCAVGTSNSQSIVSVSGIGTVTIPPDMTQMHIQFSHVAQTTKQAKEEVDRKMRQVLDILKEENIPEKNMRTVSLSYDVENGYQDGRTIWIGQRAQQTIVVTVYDIIQNPHRFPVLLDKITAIDKVAVRNIQFDTENKTALFEQSRALAYQKALDKAKQYAGLSGLKVVKTLAISEEKSREVFYGAALQNNSAAADAGFSYASPASSVPAGEQEITSEIMVTFLLK